MLKKIKQYRYSILCTLIFLTISSLSGMLVHDNMTTWYTHLYKPSFNPPSWVFAPIWTILYIFLGIICGTLLRNAQFYRTEIILFISQYICNIIWTPLFFHYHRIDLALIDILLILIITAIFTFRIRKNIKLYALSLPYLMWISFAALLNFKIYLLN